jgi:hypothetical protein
MKLRCNYAGKDNFKTYGGRGIRVCKEWNDDFKCFYAWANANGYADNLTLDRIDNDGNYEPSNCRWATWSEQQLNRSNNRLLEIDGVTQTTTEWARQVGVNPRMVRVRLHRGWDAKRAVFAPARGAA